MPTLEHWVTECIPANLKNFNISLFNVGNKEAEYEGAQDGDKLLVPMNAIVKYLGSIFGGKILNSLKDS